MILERGGGSNFFGYFFVIAFFLDIFSNHDRIGFQKIVVGVDHLNPPQDTSLEEDPDFETRSKCNP